MLKPSSLACFQLTQVPYLKEAGHGSGFNESLLVLKQPRYHCSVACGLTAPSVRYKFLGRDQSQSLILRLILQYPQTSQL